MAHFSSQAMGIVVDISFHLSAAASTLRVAVISSGGIGAVVRVALWGLAAEFVVTITFGPLQHSGVGKVRIRGFGGAHRSESRSCDEEKRFKKHLELVS